MREELQTGRLSKPEKASIQRETRTKIREMIKKNPCDAETINESIKGRSIASDTTWNPRKTPAPRQDYREKLQAIKEHRGMKKKKKQP